MKEKFIKINNLSVDKILADFIDNELLLGTNISPKKFWDGFDKVVHELAPKNRELLEIRETIQKEIDLYFKHFLSWMNSNSIPISYEKLISESAAYTLKDLLDKLEIKGKSLDIENLKKAIYFSSIKKTKEFVCI